MTTRVLFICPHAAGKSLLAATYFRAAAARHGLDVDVDVAGPDPDPVNMATVTAALDAQGPHHRLDAASGDRGRHGRSRRHRERRL